MSDAPDPALKPPDAGRRLAARLIDRRVLDGQARHALATVSNAGSGVDRFVDVAGIGKSPERHVRHVEPPCPAVDAGGPGSVQGGVHEHREPERAGAGQAHGNILGAELSHTEADRPRRNTRDALSAGLDVFHMGEHAAGCGVDMQAVIEALDLDMFDEDPGVVGVSQLQAGKPRTVLADDSHIADGQRIALAEDRSDG